MSDHLVKYCIHGSYPACYSDVKELRTGWLLPPDTPIDHHRAPCRRRTRSDVTTTCGFSQQPHGEVGLVRINNWLGWRKQFGRVLGERLGELSAKNPTSRKEREKWGTRREDRSSLRMTDLKLALPFLYFLPSDFTAAARSTPFHHSSSQRRGRAFHRH